MLRWLASIGSHRGSSSLGKSWTACAANFCFHVLSPVEGSHSHQSLQTFFFCSLKQLSEYENWHISQVISDCWSALTLSNLGNCRTKDSKDLFSLQVQNSYCSNEWISISDCKPNMTLLRLINMISIIRKHAGSAWKQYNAAKCKSSSIKVHVCWGCTIYGCLWSLPKDWFGWTELSLPTTFKGAKHDSTASIFKSFRVPLEESNTFGVWRCDCAHPSAKTVHGQSLVSFPHVPLSRNYCFNHMQETLLKSSEVCQLEQQQRQPPKATTSKTKNKHWQATTHNNRPETSDDRQPTTD